ncbi:unnamed protein product [Closterium sp. NIES-53]
MCAGGGGGGGGGSGGGGGGGSGGSGGGSGGFGGGGGGSGGSGGGGGGCSGSGGDGSGGGWGGAVQKGGFGGGQRQQQQRRSKTPTPQQLRDRAGQTCGKFHTQHRCFSRLDGASHAEFGNEAECPRWLELLRSDVDIFALDYDTILAAMYALSVSAEGDCYLCVPPDLGLEVAALGARESTLPGTAHAEALHTFILDSGASRSFFCDSTTLTPLPATFAIRLANPSGSLVLAHSSTVLPCPAVLFGSLSGIHLPLFSTKLRTRAEVLTNFGIHSVWYAAHQLNLWPRVSLPETSPTLRWTGKVGDASVFWVWGSCAFIRDMSAEKLSSRAIPRVFLGFPPDAPSRQFYHPTSSRVLLSQDVMFDESVPFYHLFPYRTAPLPPSPLFLAQGPPPVDPLSPQGLARSGVSQVDPLPLAEPVEVTVEFGAAGSSAARGAASGGAEPAGAEPWGAEPASAEPGGAEPEGAELGGAESEGADPGGAESEGAVSGGAEPRGTTSAGAPAGASPGQSRRQEPLSPRQLREWFARCTCLRSGAAGAGGPAPGGTGAGGARATSPRGARTRGTGAAGAGGVGGAGAGDPGVGGNGVGGARAGGTGAGDHGAGGTGAGGAGAGGAGAGGAGAGTGGNGAGGARAGDPGPGGAGAGGAGAGGTCAGGTVQRRCLPRPRPPLVPSTHIMALRPSSVPLRVPLPSPPADGPDPEFDLVHATSPTVPRLLATVISDPLFESAAKNALVAELVDIAAAYRLDYVASLVAEFESDCPPSVGGECALGTDVLEDTQEDFEYLAAAVPHLVSTLTTPEGDPDAPNIPTPRSYAEAITFPLLGIFGVQRPPGSPPVFKTRYVARGFSQRQGVDFFLTFSPTPKMTTFWVLLHVGTQRDNKLQSLDFSTAFLQGSLHEVIWLRRPPGFTGSFPEGTQWSLRRPVYGLRQVPREWHDTLRTTLAVLGLAPSTADPSLFLRTDTSLPPFYILVRDTLALTWVLQRLGFRYSSPQSTPLPTGHSLSAPPSDKSGEPSGPYLELVGCVMYLMNCSRPDLAYPLSILTRYVAPGRHRPEH